MAGNYMQRTLLASGKNTSSSVGVIARFGLPYGGVIAGMTIIVDTQGSVSGHAIGVYTDAGSPVAVVTQTVGTTAAKTTLVAKTTDANANRDASTTSGYTVTTSTTDSTGVYYWYVWGTVPID